MHDDVIFEEAGVLFSGRMQQDLIRLMHGPKITYVSGGHLSTVLKADAFIPAIGEFLETLDT